MAPPPSGTRPLALAASALGAVAILCALLLLTAGPDTATGGSIRVLTVDTTVVGPQVQAWFRQQVATAIQPQDADAHFVPGAVRAVYYRNATDPGRLAGATDLTGDILDQRLAFAAADDGAIFATSYAVLEVRNRTDTPDPIVPGGALARYVRSCFHAMVDAMQAWGRSADASFNPQPAAVLLIVATVLQGGSVALLAMVGRGRLPVKPAYNRGTRFYMALPSVLAAICSLASAAHVTRIIRALGPTFPVRYGGAAAVPMAQVPRAASPAFWALTWLNAIGALAVAGIAVQTVWVPKRARHEEEKGIDAEM